MEKSDILRVLEIILDDSYAIEDWQRVSDALGLPTDVRLHLNKRYSTGIFPPRDLFREILETWSSLRGKDGTVQNLAAAFKSNDFKSIADYIESCNFKGNESAGHLNFPLRYNYQGVVAKYVSRPKLEKEIIEGLRKNVNTDCQINFPIVVLHGIGGVGKTTLARKICQTTTQKQYFFFGPLFGGNFVWINAEKEESISDDFKRFFGVYKELKNIQSNLQIFFKNQLKSTQCLLVFDNVEDYKIVQNFLPLNMETKISVLITSNAVWEAGDYGEVKHIAVEKFTTQEFTEFVQKIIANISEDDIKALEEYTGRIPYLTNIVCFGLAKWKKHRENSDLRNYFLEGDPTTSSSKSPFIIYQWSAEEIVGRQMTLIEEFYEGEGTAAIKLLHILAYCYHYVRERNIRDIFNKLTGGLQSPEISASILIEQGFLETWDEGICSVHCSHQTAIKNVLKAQDKEEKVIKKLLELDLERIEFECLNIPLMWDLGKKYGDLIFEEMLTSSYFLRILVKRGEKDAVDILFGYAKRSRGIDDYVDWLLFGPTQLATYPLFIKLYKYLYEDLPMDRFGEFVEALKSQKKSEKQKRKLQNLVIMLAFRNRECIELVFNSFPKLIHTTLPESSESFLHASVYAGNLLAVEYFIENGLNVNGKDRFGDTPLHWGAESGFIEITKVLLRAGTYVDIENIFWETPLPFAAGKNSIEVADLLLSEYADPKEKDKNGRTPIDHARDKGHKEMVQLLMTERVREGPQKPFLRQLSEYLIAVLASSPNSD